MILCVHVWCVRFVVCEGRGGGERDWVRESEREKYACVSECV